MDCNIDMIISEELFKLWAKKLCYQKHKIYQIQSSSFDKTMTQFKKGKDVQTKFLVVKLVIFTGSFEKWKHILYS